MKTITNILLVAFILSGTSVFAKDYSFDKSNAKIKWTGKKVSGEHYGMINLKEGSLEMKGETIASGTFVVDMTSMTNDDLDGEWSDKLLGHLHSDDFFSTEKFGSATLKITESSAFKNGVSTVKGDLTIKGQTHPVSFDVSKEGEKLTASIKVDRTLYGIKYGSGKFFDNLGDKMIDDFFYLDVKLTLK